MENPVGRTALLTLAAAILTGGALGLAAPAAAAQAEPETVQAMVALGGPSDGGFLPSNPSGN